MSKAHKASRAARAARHGKTVVGSVIGARSARQADTTLHAPTVAQSRAMQRAQTQPRKRTYRSTRPGEPLEPLNDALTGEPLLRGTFRLWLRDYDTARELYRGEAIPYALHARQMESGPGGGTRGSGDYLGAHVLSRAALRYFAHAVVSASQRIDGQYAWWLDGYVVGRLSLHFDERMILSAVAYERGMEAREIARVYSVPIKRVIGWSHRLQQAARHYLRPGPVVPARRSRPAYHPEPTGSLTEYAESA